MTVKSQDTIITKLVVVGRNKSPMEKMEPTNTGFVRGAGLIANGVGLLNRHLLLLYDKRKLIPRSFSGK